MMGKLPKQHLLGLALTLVGVGAFLGIQISDVANQQTYASWASNDDIIDDVFRAGTPSNATIINALFGDGNGNTDDTFYTQHWSGNSCNIGAMSVVNLSPGTNTIPTSLSANTVYVLDVGVYNMTTGPISFNGDCIALVGKRTSMIYNTGAAHITSNGQSLDITNRSNVVVASIIQETSVTGSNIGIDIENSTNSTVWPIDVIAWDEGIYMENSSFVFVGGNASANRLGIGVQNNSANIYVGEIGLDNITSLIGNEIGWRIADSANVSVYNIISNASVYLGGMVENSSDILISDGTFSGNSVGVGFAGLRLSGSQNISLSGGIYVSNDGAGIWAQNVTGLTGNGLSIRSNIGGTGYGMYLESVSNISLANMTAAGNVRTNVHVTGAQNISFTNLTSTGSAEDGIQTINTTNLSILGGSFNQNTYHGIFLDAGTSGATIDNVIANVNTLAGMYIANGANYNIVTSSTVSQNGQNGIMIYESNNNSISGSTVTDTVTSAGITLYGTSSYNNTVAHTTVAQTVAGPGIVMVGGNNNLITHSIAYENNGVGMGIAGMGLSQNDSYNNTIAYSTSYNNIGYGGFGLSLDQVNNTLHDLYAYGNDTDGITIYTAGTGVNYVHDVYIYGNLDNGLYIQESENISGYNIHTYSNEMNGVRLSNTANHNYLSFVEAYDNGLNGIEVSDSATNLFENIVSFGNTNEGIYLVLKASNNTFNDLQLYNNRIGFRQSSASASKATISNTLVYNNSDAGVSLGGSSVINNAAIYNSVTGLTLQGSNNIANNVDVYNNQYGVYMTPSAMAANGKLNNVTVYNNTVGITATSSQTNTYNGLHMFDNDTPFVGTNGSDAQLTAAVPSWAIALANNLVDTGFMTCNRAVQSTNNAAQNLLVYPYCDTRGQIGGWTPTLAVQYTFFPYIYKQQQPVRYVTGSTVSTTGTVITGMFIGDFVYTGYTDFGGHINLTNEGTTYASGGFIYRYDNGPFDIEMNANTGTTKGFVVTGVNDILWDGVVGSIGSFAGLQYPLVSQYMIAGNGLKIFRGGYDIAGEGLVSNYYGQIRGIAAPVCGDTIVEYTEQCDDGNTNNSDGCDSTCQIEQWNCGWFSGRTSTGLVPHNITVSIVSGLSLAPYTFDVIVWGDSTANGSITTGNTHTYMTGGSYTGSIQVVTQTSLISSVNTTCEFPVTAIDPTYCGDGVIQSPNGSGLFEQCDDNLGGCNLSTCTLYTGSCTMQASQSTGYAPFNAIFTGVGSQGFLFDYIDYGDGTTGTNYTNHIYSTSGVYNIIAYEYNISSGSVINTCGSQIQVLDTTYCGDGAVNQPSEQCDDGNADEFDGCDSQCITNSCSTTVLHTIDPMITYQRGYPNYSPNTGMTFVFTTPTTGTGYTYQRNVSGIDLSNVNSMQITGSSTGTDIQVYVDANTSPASFTGLIELEVGNGVITGYVNGTLTCNGASCQYSWISYEFESIGGFTTQGDYNISFVSQNIANNIANPLPLFSYQVRSWPTPVEININIYTCDINQWLVDADAAGLFGTSALAAFTSGDFLDAYNSGTLPPIYQFYCTTGDYPWQGGVADGLVTYAVLYATGSSMVYGEQTQDFGPHTYIVDSGQNTDTIIFDRADIQTGAIASNNVGIQYMNSCVGMCGNGIVESISGSTTSGTINYPIYADISANTGYNVNNQFGYASGGIFTFTGDINTGTAVTYQWTLSGSSLNPAITGFIVGSSTGASVSIFGNSMGYTGGSSSWIGTLTLEISDALGNVITTQGYFTIYLDGMTIIYPSADSISISGSQVTYDDYIINLAGTAGLRPPDQFYTNTGPAWTQLGVFASGGVVGFDRYGDDIYDYSTGDNPVSYNYNVTGSSITTNLSFASTGSFSLGNIYQSIVFTTTTGVNIGGGQERCDDGNSIDGDGCSSTCDLETPSCNWFTVTAQTGYAPHNFTISILPNIYTGSYTFYDIRWMTGQTSSIFGNDTFTYTGVGSYNPNIRIRPFATSQAQVLQTLTCSRPVTVLSSCGNFIVEQNEQCDDGNTSPNDGCSSQCTFEIPQTCGLSGNLVPNPGFESYTQCPTSYGQGMTGYVASWDRRGGDPDYGHMNCPYGITGFFSYLQQYPHLGSGAINILTYASNIPAGGREYMSVELVTPLQIGNYYDVGFCFATHAGSHYITDSLGVLFTNNPNLYGVGFAPIAQTPQFEHTGYAQGSGWTCVSGTVLADQAYDRLILGSFQTNTGQNMIPNPIYQTGVGVSGYTVANYMIDDIFVSEKCATCGDGSQAQSEQCDLGTGNTTSCTPGYGQTCNYCSLSCTTGTQTGAYCGDTVVSPNDGEQCDDGNQNNTDGCNNSCQRAQPTCTLLLTPSAGTYPLNVLFSLNMNAGSSLIHMNYGDGTTGTSVTGHTYTTGGLFTPIAYIQNSSNTGLTAICPANTVITVVNGYTPVCGNAIVDTGSNEVCDLGTGNAASCTPGYGQSCSYCSLSCQPGTGQGGYCGDNIINGSEQCDGGNGCRTNCTRGGSSCFPAGTKVTLDDGTYKNIEDVLIGDKVLGNNIGTETISTVTALESPIRDHMCTLVFEDKSELQLTREHPIYTTQGWKSINPEDTLLENPTLVDVSVLHVGDRVISQTGQKVLISIDCIDTTIQTYNLKTVIPGNTFYADGVLVHNKGTTLNKDDCDGEDESPSYYDGKCEGKPKHTAAPVGRACKYEDEKYIARGPFTDTLKHRALPYTEMMRASCMWRGRDTDEGQWHANPNENITVAEVLKTFVKVEGVAFDDFDIKTENARYPKATPFADIPQDHWFAWYADYAVKKGLTKGLATNKDGKNYIDPDRHITRNDAVKLMMVTYDAINKKKVSINGTSVLGDVVNASDPYYQYIRKAEALGFISGVKQKDGTYRFDGKRAITRAEFAKIVSVPFNDQLFDTSSLVLNSPVYVAIVKALDKVQGDKIDFINTLLLNMAKIPDTQFIKKFKVTKVIFIQELRNAILPGLYEDASN